MKIIHIRVFGTDTDLANLVEACRILQERYPSIYWRPVFSQSQSDKRTVTYTHPVIFGRSQQVLDVLIEKIYVPTVIAFIDGAEYLYTDGNKLPLEQFVGGLVKEERPFMQQLLLDISTTSTKKHKSANKDHKKIPV